MSNNKQLNQKLESLTDTVTSMNTKMTNLETQLEFVIKGIENLSKSNDEIKHCVEDVKKTVRDIEKRVSQCEVKLADLNKQHKILYDRVVYLESQSRRDNLRLEGVPETPPGVKEDCNKIVYEVLSQKLSIPNARSIKIVRCHRLGPPPRANNGVGSRNPHPRPILFKLHWFGDRQAIWEARFKLKGTKMFINEDFPKEIMQNRKMLLPVVKAAKKAGNKAFLSVDKLHIVKVDPMTNKENHTVVSVDTLHKLPPELDAKFISTKKTNDCFSFFGQLCPLSNFHQVSVMYKNMNFNSSEQLYQYRKAEAAGDEIACRNILQADSPLDAKRLGDKVKPGRTWDTERIQVMKDTLILKLTQNIHVKTYLNNITQEVIAESSPHDTFWGTGIALDKNEATQPNHWTGSNFLGKIFNELRQELS